MDGTLRCIFHFIFFTLSPSNYATASNYSSSGTKDPTYEAITVLLGQSRGEYLFLSHSSKICQHQGLVQSPSMKLPVKLLGEEPTGTLVLYTAHIWFDGAFNATFVIANYLPQSSHR